MNAYSSSSYLTDMSFLDIGFSDHLLHSHEIPAAASTWLYSNNNNYNYNNILLHDHDDDHIRPPSLNSKGSPPSHRHDGTSPLPLGMDWSPPPRSWNGRDTIWPHDPHTGWSYCVTIPSWTVQSDSRGSSEVVFYRVQVGLQTPEAFTTTREVLHRFSDFLELFSELKKIFPKKNLPSAPPRRLLGSKSEKLNEERRSALEDWMEKLLSDIAISRSAPVAIFLELEAAARASFEDSYGHNTSSLPEHEASSNMSSMVDTSSVASDCATDGTGHGKSEIGSLKHEVVVASELSRGDSTSDSDVTSASEARGAYVVPISGLSSGDKLLDNTVQTTSTSGDFDEGRFYKGIGTKNEDMQISGAVVALPTEQHPKFSRVLVTMEQRLATAKADMEDLVARLNQELAVRQYLTSKVKYLEVELDTMKENTKDKLELTLSSERERYTQMQWDIEELRKKCLEMEVNLKAEQDGKAQMESKHMAALLEKEMLMQELDAAREELRHLKKHHEESEVKAKTDIKVLVKEVKSLRSSQSELKQEAQKLTLEKLEIERTLQNKKQEREKSSFINGKLLHECAVLLKRLQECSINFKLEKDNRLTIDAASPSDVTDQLSTSDNRIGFLLAEAQLMAQDVENLVTSAERTSEGQLRKMLADIFIDDATVRKQMNSVLRCALDMPSKSELDDNEEEATPRETVLSKFL